MRCARWVSTLAEQVGEILLERAKREVAHARAGIELHEHVDVAAGTKVLTYGRTEE